MSDPVLKLLNDNSLNFTVSGRDYLIQCLNPDHEDTNPSCRVDKITGVTHCFACGFKTNLFKFYGLITNHSSIRIAKLKEKLNDLKTTMADAEAPKGSIPYSESIRGISVKTLKHFGAFRTNDDEKYAGMIIFPIKDVSGKTVLYQARHTLSNAHPKYTFFPRHISPPCFPASLEEPSTSLILVEGVFDMLNLYDNGLRNVTCIFGTQGLNNTAKEKLLPFKVQGVNRIFIMFDGDKAGREAAASLKPVLEELDFTTEIIDMDDDLDPGECSKEFIEYLIGYTK